MLDILFLSRSSLLYAVLLLSAITILSLALPCFAYEATQKFRRRRSLFKKDALPKRRGGPAAFARFQKKQRRRKKPAALSVSVETTSYLIFRAST